MPPSEPETVSPAALREWPLPEPDGGKGSRGRVLVLGGAKSSPGAAMLAGLAALRVGAGVLTLAVSESVAAAVAAAVPESGVIWLPDRDVTLGEAVDAVAGYAEKVDAVAIGPGLDDAEIARTYLSALLQAVPDGTPFVLDAYGLSALAEMDRTGVDALAGRLVLTPNSSELDLLLKGAGASSDENDGAEGESGGDSDGASNRDSGAATVAVTYGAVISSGNTVAAPSGRAWLVPAGHPGLGTSGSGDVLAGAVVGLLARGAPLEQATVWATYLHATAGDRLAAEVGALGFLARDLVDRLPAVLAELKA